MNPYNQGGMIVALMGNVSEKLIESCVLTGNATIRRVPGFDSKHRQLSARTLIDACKRERTGNEPLIVLTSRDITIPGREWVFGYADREMQTAVVSTFRLEDSTDPSVLSRRLVNQIAHELGVLSGLKHCSRGGCVMKPVVSPEELDRRSAKPCGYCPRTWSAQWRRAAIAALVSVTTFIFIDSMAPVYTQSTAAPFVYNAGSTDTAHISFDGKVVLALRDKAGHTSVRDRSLPVIETLNRLYRQATPPRFDVVRLSNRRARILVAGEPVLDVLPGDLKNESAMQLARKWVTALETIHRKR